MGVLIGKQIQLRAYAVVKDKDGNPKKGDLVKYGVMDLDGNLWAGHVKGLQPDTEYYVELRLWIHKDFTVLTYAYKTLSAGKLRTSSLEVMEPPPPGK